MLFVFFRPAGWETREASGECSNTWNVNNANVVLYKCKNCLFIVSETFCSKVDLKKKAVLTNSLVDKKYFKLWSTENNCLLLPHISLQHFYSFLIDIQANFLHTYTFFPH